MYSSNKIQLDKLADFCGFSVYPYQIDIKNEKNQHGDVKSMKLFCSNQSKRTFLRLNIDNLENDNINVIMDVRIPAIFQNKKCMIEHSIIAKSDNFKLKIETLNDYCKICEALLNSKPLFIDFKFEIEANFSGKEVNYKQCYLTVENYMNSHLSVSIPQIYGIEPTNNFFETIDNILELNGLVYEPEKIDDLLSVIQMQRI